MRDGGLADMQSAAQVHVRDRSVLLGRDLYPFQRLGDFGIVDQDISPTEYVQHD